MPLSSDFSHALENVQELIVGGYPQEAYDEIMNLRKVLLKIDEHNRTQRLLAKVELLMQSILTNPTYSTWNTFLKEIPECLLEIKSLRSLNGLMLSTGQSSETLVGPATTPQS